MVNPLANDISTYVSMESDTPSNKTDKQNRRRGALFWIILALVGLLLFVCASFLADFSSLRWLWLLFAFDQRHWPAMLAWTLWGLFLWSITDFFCTLLYQSDAMNVLPGRSASWKARICLLAVLLAPFCYTPVSAALYKHYYLPLHEWMATGQFAWQILLGPAVALVLITWLCQVARRNRKR